MPTWPFSRGRAAWVSGNRITRAIAELWDDQLSNAADGRVWSDVAIAQNWFLEASNPLTFTKACAWDQTRGYWLIAGDNGTDANACIMYRSGGYTAVTDPGTSLEIGPEAAVVTPGGVWIVGGNPAGSSAAKIRRSANGGSSWSSVNTNAGGTSSVSLLHYFAATARIIAGLDNGDIETSDNSGSTWTARTEPNTNPRNNAASSDDICVVTSTSSTDKVITSPDGITWTERTMPSSGVWAVAWSESSGVFLAINSTTAAKSTDGINWTSTGVTVPGGTVGLCCLGHVFVTYGTAGTGLSYTSIDEGATWVPAAKLVAGPMCMRAGDNQLVAVANAGSVDTTYRTLALGGR